MAGSGVGRCLRFKVAISIHGMGGARNHAPSRREVLFMNDPLHPVLLPPGVSYDAVMKLGAAIGQQAASTMPD